ncbi:hypothetical protein [Sulfurimonas sp. HSL3-2]|uniref:hypothetical protein n=1 Tax=Hydrocurvibacter mobilis TaxID=3131936 RepID=UPI0031F8B9D1
MSNLLRRFKVFIVVLLIATFSFPAMACEGQEKEESLNIIYEALFAGYEAGITLDFQKLMDKTRELENRQGKLSNSCKNFIQTITSQLGPVYTPTSTHCTGSVCCDGSSCFSN